MRKTQINRSRFSESTKAILIFSITFVALLLLLLAVNNFSVEELIVGSALTKISEFLVASVAVTSLYIAVKKFLVNQVHSINVNFGIPTEDYDPARDNGISCQILNNGPNLITVNSVLGYGVQKDQVGDYKIGLLVKFLKTPIKSGENKKFKLFNSVQIYEASHIDYKTSDQKFRAQPLDYRKGLRPLESQEKEADEQFLKLCDLFEYVKKLVQEDNRHNGATFSEEEIEEEDISRLKELADKRTDAS